MDDQTYSCHTDDAHLVIAHFCNSMPLNPLEKVELSEATEIFKTTFPMTEEHRHHLTDDSMMEFLQRLHEISVDRTLGEMVEKGLIDYSHDGEQFVFSLTEKGKQYPV